MTDAACPSRYAATTGTTAGAVIACRQQGRHTIHSNLADNPADRVLWVAGDDGEIPIRCDWCRKPDATHDADEHPLPRDHADYDAFFDASDDELAAMTADALRNFRGAAVTADRTLHAIDATLAATAPEDTMTDPTPAPTDWIPLNRRPGRGCGHTPDQHLAMSGADADLRSLERDNRELIAERDNARRQCADLRRELIQTRDALDRAGIQPTVTTSTPDLVDQLAAERIRAELEETKQTSTRLRKQRDLMRGYRDAAEELADFRQGVNDSLRQDLSDAGDVIDAARDAAERLGRALAAYDTPPTPTPGSPADHAQDEEAQP